MNGYLWPECLSFSSFALLVVSCVHVFYTLVGVWGTGWWFVGFIGFFYLVNAIHSCYLYCKNIENIIGNKFTRPKGHTRKWWIGGCIFLENSYICLYCIWFISHSFLCFLHFLLFKFNVSVISTDKLHDRIWAMSLSFVWSFILLICSVSNCRHSDTCMFLQLKAVGFRRLMWTRVYQFMSLWKLLSKKLNSMMKQVSVISLLAISQNVLL